MCWLAFHTWLVLHFSSLHFGLAFSSPQSCIFHPCILVPLLPVLHFPPLHFYGAAFSSPELWPVGGSELRSYFSPFVDQSSPDHAVFRLSISCSLPEIFAIEVRSRPKSRQKTCFSAPNFFGEDPQILDLVFKNAPISDHVAQFRGDRPIETAEISRWIKKERKERNSTKI